jgi:hypothetical protein
MDLTLQSYFNEAVFSAGRGPEATFVSYLERDSSKEALEACTPKPPTQQLGSSASEKSVDVQLAGSDPEECVLTAKGSFISYIDDDSDADAEANSDDQSVGSDSVFRRNHLDAAPELCVQFKLRIVTGPYSVNELTNLM